MTQTIEKQAETPHYPEIEIELTGVDGNAFAIIGACRKVARRKLTKEQLEEFQNEAMSGDYDNVLQTCMRYFNVH